MKPMRCCDVAYRLHDIVGLVCGQENWDKPVTALQAIEIEAAVIDLVSEIEKQQAVTANGR